MESLFLAGLPHGWPPCHAMPRHAIHGIPMEIAVHARPCKKLPMPFNSHAMPSPCHVRSMLIHPCICHAMRPSTPCAVHAMPHPCHAPPMPCATHAAQCHAMPCDDHKIHVFPWSTHAVLFFTHVYPCGSMPCHVTHAMPCHATKTIHVFHANAPMPCHAT